MLSQAVGARQRRNILRKTSPNQQCVPAPLLRILCLQANASAADDVHRLKCELVYMHDREEKLKQEVAEAKQELQVRACC
jgi:hypothetical protein